MKRLILLLAAGMMAMSAFAHETNPTYSPDSSYVAYTDGGNLFVRPAAGGAAVRLTDDGSDVILNGHASWVYYEEIFGRPSRYKAFWWSPDSRKLAFYRFDNSVVKMFPIYSPYGGKGGSLSETRYPLAGKQCPDTLFVSIDYRLGFLGFMNFERVPGGENFKEAGNLGLLDQLESLRWIQKNIAAFGGDPDNVTIFGESAGSASVTFLPLIDGSEGLFKRIIAQSANIAYCDTMEHGIHVTLTIYLLPFVLCNL